jgi:hypothetical protein
MPRTEAATGEGLGRMVEPRSFPKTARRRAIPLGVLPFVLGYFGVYISVEGHRDFLQ